MALTGLKWPLCASPCVILFVCKYKKYRFVFWLLWSPLVSPFHHSCGEFLPAFTSSRNRTLERGLPVRPLVSSQGYVWVLLKLKSLYALMLLHFKFHA